MIRPILILLLFCSSLASSYAATGNEFPGRKLYLAVPIIELDKLYEQHKRVVFVDVRSAYEYKTLRIKGAVNIPLSSRDFVNRMKQLRSKAGNWPIVVYCNGKTCMKSYKAVSKCRKHHIENVIAYDTGVMDWARKYPKESVLLGHSPVDRKKLINKEQFRNHLLNPVVFEERVAKGDALVLDVRDRFQREGIGIFVGKEHRAPLDDEKLVDQFLDQAKSENRTVLIYDAAGKQVRWLMYHIKEKGLKKYYFMEGGALAYFNSLREQYVR